jgi:DnaK suppressor protein
MDAMQQQAMAQAAENRASLQVRRIEAALMRLQRAEFGYCGECGELLDAGRLSADPCAVLCVPCTEEQTAQWQPGWRPGKVRADA